MPQEFHKKLLSSNFPEGPVPSRWKCHALRTIALHIFSSSTWLVKCPWLEVNPGIFRSLFMTENSDTPSNCRPVSLTNYRALLYLHRVYTARRSCLSNRIILEDNKMTSLMVKSKTMDVVHSGFANALDSDSHRLLWDILNIQGVFPLMVWWVWPLLPSRWFWFKSGAHLPSTAFPICPRTLYFRINVTYLSN